MRKSGPEKNFNREKRSGEKIRCIVFGNAAKRLCYDYLKHKLDKKMWEFLGLKVLRISCSIAPNSAREALQIFPCNPIICINLPHPVSRIKTEAMYGICGDSSFV